MPDLGYLVTQLPGLVIGTVVGTTLTFLANRYLQNRSHVNATLGKWYDRRIEKLEAISRTAWKLDRKARKLFHCRKKERIAEVAGTIEDIRELQNELEILTQFYAPLLIEFRIRAEKAMDELESHVALLSSGDQNSATDDQIAEALGTAMDHLRYIRNAAMGEAQKYLDPSDSRWYAKKGVEVHTREEHYATIPLHSDET